MWRPVTFTLVTFTAVASTVAAIDVVAFTVSASATVALRAVSSTACDTADDSTVAFASTGCVATAVSAATLEPASDAWAGSATCLLTQEDDALCVSLVSATSGFTNSATLADDADDLEGRAHEQRSGGQMDGEPPQLLTHHLVVAVTSLIATHVAASLPWRSAVGS